MSIRKIDNSFRPTKVKDIQRPLKSSTQQEDLAGRTVYFTISPGSAGFTDQMMQFSAFYKLGRALGYEYVHIPFQSLRSIQTQQTWWEKLFSRGREAMDIYEFLAFNRYMQSMSRPCKFGAVEESLDIPLGQQTFLQQPNVSFQALSDYVRDIVDNYESESKPLLVRFRLTGEREFFTVIHAQIPVLQDNLDLLSAFLRSARPVQPSVKYSNRKVSILVHIRQGDTAVITTPWNTYIPVDKRKEGWLQEHAKPEEICGGKNHLGPIFSVRDYYDFTTALVAEFDRNIFSIRLFSDGFKRAFDIVSANLDLLDLNTSQMRSLKKAARHYNKHQFRVFKRLANCNQYVGETNRKLQMLIYTLLKAEIIIIGFQQRMLPKFLANYRFNDMPAVIVLHKGLKPDFSVIASGWEDQFIFVDIRNPDFVLITNRLVQLVSRLRDIAKPITPLSK